MTTLTITMTMLLPIAAGFPVTCQMLPPEKYRVLWAVQTKTVNMNAKPKQNNSEYHGVCETFSTKPQQKPITIKGPDNPTCQGLSKLSNDVSDDVSVIV